MRRTALVILAMVTLSGVARADVAGVGDALCPIPEFTWMLGPSRVVFGSDPAKLVWTEDVVLSNVLKPFEAVRGYTFNAQENDVDKDGWVDEALAGMDANPNGYVLFHFRSRDHNVRVSFDQLFGGALNLAHDEMGGSLPPMTHASSSPPAEPTPPPGPPAVVPEPVTLSVLMAGGALLALRRSRRNPLG